MLLIQKGAINTLTLTLTEKCSLTNPNFLFYFKSRVNGSEVSIVLNDVSNFTYRYNQFLFNEAPYDMLEGFWDYEVYEQTGTGTDRTLGTKIEDGVLKVTEPRTITATTYTTTSTSTVYDSSLIA